MNVTTPSDRPDPNATSFPVRRAVADPPCITWAPFEIAVLNILAWLFVGMLFAAMMNITPIVFIVLAIIVHGFLSVWGAREPHLATIAVARYFSRLPRASPKREVAFVP